MNRDRILEGINKLSISEKLFIIGEIWDNINLGPKDLPITEYQKEELRNRLQSFELGEEKMEDWGTVKEKLKNKYE